MLQLAQNYQLMKRYGLKVFFLEADGTSSFQESVQLCDEHDVLVIDIYKDPILADISYCLYKRKCSIIIFGRA